METTINNTDKVSSKTKSVLTLCLIAVIIAFTVTIISKIDLHEFVNNILSWDTI